MADSVVFMPVRELGELVRTRQVSPVELAETFLDRLETIGPQLNAVATVTRERAIQQARRAEEEIASGKYRGPLHGIPYGVKDLLATSGGIPTTWGAAPFRDQTFDYDATVVRRLEEAGAVLAAKLATMELAAGMGTRYASASLTGPGINPWDQSTWSGGSSNGPGSAVSGGLVSVLPQPEPSRITTHSSAVLTADERAERTGRRCLKPFRIACSNPRSLPRSAFERGLGGRPDRFQDITASDRPARIEDPR